MTESIGILNIGTGNFKSLANAITYIGNYSLVISSDISELDLCDRLYLPGVGSFAAASQSGKLPEIADLIQQFAKSSRPILGICLGMQLFFCSSSEGGNHRGLQIVEGDVSHFYEHPDYSEDSNMIVPHVGFSTVEQLKPSALFAGIPNSSLFYFTHSYYAPPSSSAALGHTRYREFKFTSAINISNIYGVQFHPELSGESGLTLLKNFQNL